MRIDLSEIHDVRLVIIGYKIKNKKGDKLIKFNSRVQVFPNYSEATRFEIEIMEKFRADKSLIYEVFYISRTQQPIPEDLEPGSKYYCPYCGNLNYLKSNPVTGYRVCPICGVSMTEFYFRKYNNLWLKDQKNTNKGNKIKKRRKKDDNN